MFVFSHLIPTPHHLHLHHISRIGRRSFQKYSIRINSSRLPYCQSSLPTNPHLRTLSPTPSQPLIRSRAFRPAPLAFVSYRSSSNSTTSRLSSPLISCHLSLVAALVFTIVVVGGLTRLTESGLSITEWNLVSGILPPLSDESWQSEFEKYRSTPEWRLLNHSITLHQFKTIYYWEWAHRLIGRIIGLSFLIPLPFLMRSGAVKGQKVRWSLCGIGTLIGAQGALGWYMVQSGLDQLELDRRDGIPRVSQYRLAAHLLMAFGLYASCLRLAGGIWRDWKVGMEGQPLAGRQKGLTAMESINFLQSGIPSRARVIIAGLTGLIMLTATSGAFVAGLDAGLVYNTFPKMGEQWAPPISELISDTYSSRLGSTSQFGWLRNFFENPTTVQFNHRILAGLTFCTTLGTFTFVNRHRNLLPVSTLHFARGMMAMAAVQVGLGISTLVYLVPTGLAAAHQAGSLLLLTLSLGTGLSLRRPSPQALNALKQLIAKSSSRSILPQSMVKTTN
ncbi:hypothetical protein O181_027703 [Austropuccinia psidii MF-1]|uniref:Cytochrome c oxidase assembly protein COX15 n=1 Tax=Austropuccinia psidii MF-1 TaxID=1389203 RepID=A0A9Q3H157_9BASI|nr:hypothetical protein [Austropuccinia psidii MF-1]